MAHIPKRAVLLEQSRKRYISSGQRNTKREQCFFRFLKSREIQFWSCLYIKVSQIKQLSPSPFILSTCHDLNALLASKWALKAGPFYLGIPEAKSRDHPSFKCQHTTCRDYSFMLNIILSQKFSFQKEV